MDPEFLEYYSNNRDSKREVGSIKNPCSTWYTAILLVLTLLLTLLASVTQMFVALEKYALDVTLAISLGCYALELLCYVMIPVIRCLPGISCTTCLWNKNTFIFVIFHISRSIQFMLIILHIVIFPWSIVSYSVEILALLVISALLTITIFGMSLTFVALKVCTVNNDSK